MTGDSQQIVSDLQIVRCYEDHSAPTGEGTRYETVDGRVYHDTQPFERPEGNRVGTLIIPIGS